MKRLWNKELAWILVLGSGLMTSSCSSSGSQVGPIDLAFLVPSNFETTGTLTAGFTDTYTTFDLRRQRDGVLITDPLAVYVNTQGSASGQEALTDDLDNPIYTNRAVVLLGNGSVKDGELQPPPTEVPSILTSPLQPYTPPTGWNARASLNYFPTQGDIPNRAANGRFGVYLSSILPFTVQLGFATRDVQDVIASSAQTYTFRPTATQPVTVGIDNATGSSTAPILVAICNQVNAAVLVGLKDGSVTTLAVPELGTAATDPLNTDTAYRAEAYQFNSAGAVQAISFNPEDPADISVPLLDAAHPGGSVSLTLANSTDGDVVTCFGDKVSDINTLIPGLFSP